jgi:hypothetical protein
MATINIPKPELKGFVIYNPANQLFSGGGSMPKWKKKPKIWANIGHLKNHLLGALDRGCPRDYYSSPVKKYEVSSVYFGCEVYDIINDQKIDFDIYEYFENHVLSSYYGKNGYKLIYV